MGSGRACGAILRGLRAYSWPVNIDSASSGAAEQPGSAVFRARREERLGAESGALSPGGRGQGEDVRSVICCERRPAAARGSTWHTQRGLPEPGCLSPFTLTLLSPPAGPQGLHQQQCRWHSAAHAMGTRGGLCAHTPGPMHPIQRAEKPWGEHQMQSPWLCLFLWVPQCPGNGGGGLGRGSAWVPAACPTCTRGAAASAWPAAVVGSKVGTAGCAWGQQGSLQPLPHVGEGGVTAAVSGA